MSENQEALIDCTIVGGGPAGLTAALYLARFGRSFLLVDEGKSRAEWIPRTRNIPGFPDGIGGADILERQRDHLRRYGMVPLRGRVAGLVKRPECFVSALELADGNARNVPSRQLLLATGSIDQEPELPDLPDAVQRGLIRFCPICDGYEVAGRRIGVIGRDHHGVGEAIFIARTYSAHVTLLSMGEPIRLDPDQQAQLAAHQITVLQEPVAALEVRGDGIVARYTGGDEQRFELLYSALGLKRRSDLALKLGAEHDETGAVKTDEHSATSVLGLYAAGGVVRGLDQILVAMGQGAIAATSIHNRCELPTEQELNRHRSDQSPLRGVPA